MGCTHSQPEIVTANLHNVNLSLLKTGDIVLFSSRSTLGTRMIQRFTNSKWTHIGVVVNSPGLYPTRGPMLFESGNDYTDHLRDISTETIISSGVRLVDLSARIKCSKHDEIAFMSLSTGKLDWDPNVIELKMQQVISELSMKPYEQRPIELFMSAIDWTSLTHNKPDLSSVFCSELVAVTLQHLCVLSDKESSNEYVPGDFVKATLTRELLHSASYGVPKSIKTTVRTKYRTN